MKRAVVLGPGGSGKSTFAVQLGALTGLPVVELDKLFWGPNLEATSHRRWIEIQRQIVQRDAWILDGDLGPYDAVDIRLQAADAIFFLDFSLLRCVWQALRRGPERLDFWIWLLGYRQRSRPYLLNAIAAHSLHATVHILRGPRDVSRILADLRQ